MKPLRYKQFGADMALLIFRAGIALSLMLGHGLSKLKRLFSGNEIRFSDPIGIGPELSLVATVGAEFFCSLLLLVGFLTRFALLPIIFTMLVIIFIVHWGDSFREWEKALLYLIACLTLLFLGPGKYSLDAWLFRKKATA
jgi:putative oxidoreductase